MLKLSEVKPFVPFVIDGQVSAYFMIIGTLKTNAGISYLMLNIEKGYIYLEANTLQETELVEKSFMDKKTFLVKILEKGIFPDPEVEILFKIAYGKENRTRLEDF